MWDTLGGWILDIEMMKKSSYTVFVCLIRLNYI